MLHKAFYLLRLKVEETKMTTKDTNLTIFIPEQTDIRIPDTPVRTIGIDLGTTNSTVAEAIFDPKSSQTIKVRCLEVDQLTEIGKGKRQVSQTAGRTPDL